MNLDIVSLVASLIALVFSLLNTRNVGILPSSKLAGQRFLARIVAVGSLITIAAYPITALTVDPRHGIRSAGWLPGRTRLPAGPRAGRDWGADGGRGDPDRAGE